jgi:hypothetical protein
MRGAGHVSRIREMRNGYRILVGKPEGKGRVRTLIIIGEKIFKMDLF